MKEIKGDFQVDEIKDIEFVGSFGLNWKISSLNSAAERMARKSSIVFKDISKEDLKCIRERELTPDIHPSKKMITEVDSDEMDTNKSHQKISKYLHESSNRVGSPKKSQSNFGSYVINTDQSSLLKLSPNYKTNDYDLKNLCELINEKKDQGWKEVYVQNKISIFKKNPKGSHTIMIKTNAEIDNFTKEEVFNAISDVNIRKEWDKIFSEFKILENNPKEGKEYLYMSIKSPSIFVADRDFVQQRRIWKDFPDNNSVMIHFKSVEHPMAPLRNKFVRAVTIISGYFIQTISVNPPKVLISIISQTDIGGSIPKWLVNSVSQKAPKDWIANLVKGCAMVRNAHN